MNSYIYSKQNRYQKYVLLRVVSIAFSVGGLGIGVYVFFPVLMWQVYFAPVFASQVVTAPIPKTTILSSVSLHSLLESGIASLSGVDYSNVQNWFPGLKLQKTQKGNLKVLSYGLSIPKLHIKNATVSTIDTNLDMHLINYMGTPIPADKGNAIIVGHSTLPQ